MIHPMALVHADCDIGEGSSVWQFASVLRGARLGAGSSVGACAVVDGSRIGDRARIGHGAQVHPGLVAGDGLFVGPGAIVCNDLWPWLGAQDFDLEALLTGRALAVICEDNVTIGAGAIILPGTRLKAGCVIAAGAVARNVVPADSVVYRDGTVKPIDPRARDRMLYAA